MKNRRIVALILAVAVPMIVSACGGLKIGATDVRWFCCLGGGDAEEQVTAEKAVVDKFNASHSDINLKFEFQPYDAAYDIFATEVRSGNPPDVVGPLGIGGGNAFPGLWLDLTDLIAEHKYDLTQFPDNTVQIYQAGGEGQLGIPFAIYPSALFYKKGLFDEAGLKEPPHTYGDPYVMPDGTSVPWDYDTVRKIAMLLTVDKNGKDATQAGFDPDNIVQWGFEPQRDDLRQTGADWGAGSLVASDGKTAQIPDAWAAAWHWFYDGMWKDHFSMTGPQFQSPDFNPSDYPFFTGNVAMSENYLWSTYGVGDSGKDWNLAAIPSYNGQTTAAFNADTFRITKQSKNHEKAWEVMTYLLDDARAKLLKTYGGMPARTGEQTAFFTDLSSQFEGQTIDWQVAIDGIQFADVPNFEGPMPDYNKATDTLNTFSTKWQATKGLDLDKEIAALRDALQAVFDQAKQ
jgi:multiple sugar transport system substrate-binding protein